MGAVAAWKSGAVPISTPKRVGLTSVSRSAGTPPTSTFDTLPRFVPVSHTVRVFAVRPAVWSSAAAVGYGTTGTGVGGGVGVRVGLGTGPGTGTGTGGFGAGTGAGGAMGGGSGVGV